jgi:hypothetical protein
MCCGGIFDYLINLINDFSKYQNEPEYQSLIKSQEQIYYNENEGNYSYDPMWQDRRMMSFFNFRNSTANKCE